MNSFQLFWEHSPLWLLPVLLFSAGLAWWQYAGNQDFGKRLSLVLALIRTSVFFILGLLLLNPLLRFFKENQLPPISVILIDNSRSVKLASKEDSLMAFNQNLSALRKKLAAAGNQVFLEGLNGPLSDTAEIAFNTENSNLENALRKIQSTYEGQNLSQVILASDGIVNQGGDLQDARFPFQVHCIGLGNPGAGKDLKISELRHNKLVYLGNQFPVQVELKSSGLQARQVNVRLLEGGKPAGMKTITLSPSGLGKAEFSLKAIRKGIQEFEVLLDSFPGEVTFENNRRKFFIEVVSEKQKVLLLAASPHPDLKAIKSALEPIEQIQLTTLIAGMDAFRPESYSLVILHQLPDRAGSFSREVSQFLKNQNTAVFLIATAFTNFNKLRLDAGDWLNIQGSSGQAEEAGNRFESSFQRFLYEENFIETLGSLPPIKSPNASFSWKGPSETVINQLIGRVASPTPLLSVQMKQDSRRALFWGDGIWLWRMNEFAKNENSEAVDHLIQKTCQLLINSGKKKQLLVQSASDEYSESDVPTFQIETFNQLMEPVFDKRVRLSIRRNGGEAMEFSMVTAPGNPPLKIRTLPSGAYHFTATTNLDGKELKEEGDFIVRSFDLEARQLEAEHGLLKGLADRNKGAFFYIQNMCSLPDKQSAAAPLVEFTDWNENLLSMKWMLAILLILLSAEWLLRKMNGSV